MAINEDEANKKKKKKAPFATQTQRAQAGEGRRSLTGEDVQKVFAGVKDYTAKASDIDPRELETLKSTIGATKPTGRFDIDRFKEQTTALPTGQAKVGRERLMQRLEPRTAPLGVPMVAREQFVTPEAPIEIPQHGIDTPSRQTTPIVPTAFGRPSEKLTPDLFGTRQAVAGGVEGEIPTVGRGVPTPTQEQLDLLFPGGQAVGAPEERDSFVNYGTPFEKRMREGDVFSHGAVGEFYRRIGRERSVIERQMKKGEIGPRRGQEALGQLMEQEAKARTATAPEAGKAGVAAQKLGLEAQKFGLAQKRLEFDVDKERNALLREGRVTPERLNSAYTDYLNKTLGEGGTPISQTDYFAMLGVGLGNKATELEQENISRTSK